MQRKDPLPKKGEEEMCLDGSILCVKRLLSPSHDDGGKEGRKDGRFSFLILGCFKGGRRRMHFTARKSISRDNCQIASCTPSLSSTLLSRTKKFKSRFSLKSTIVIYSDVTMLQITVQLLLRASLVLRSKSVKKGYRLKKLYKCPTKATKLLLPAWVVFSFSFFYATNTRPSLLNKEREREEYCKSAMAASPSLYLPVPVPHLFFPVPYLSTSILLSCLELSPSLESH